MPEVLAENVKYQRILVNAMVILNLKIKVEICPFDLVQIYANQTIFDRMTAVWMQKLLFFLC